MINYEDVMADDTDDTAREARLSSAWKAFIDGRASADDAGLIMLDLAIASGYFHVTPDVATTNDILRAEGARSVFARVMYLVKPDARRLATYIQALNASAKYGV